MNKRNLLIMKGLCTVLLVSAFLFDTPQTLFKGLIDIIVSPDILLTDYIEVGGLGASLLNASLMGWLNILVMEKTNTEADGLTIAALFTIIGFSFIGKNIYNFWPFYIGGFLYAKVKKNSANTVVKVLMFATTLSPIVSELSFGTQLPVPFGAILGIIIGIGIGFIIVPISKTMYQSHKGYSLYNVGLAGGLVGTVVFSVLRSFDIIMATQDIISTDYHDQLLWMIVILSLFFIVYAFVVEKTTLRHYALLLKETGHKPAEFEDERFAGAMYLNIGLLGFVSLLYVLMIGTPLNGPIVAGIFTVMGFGAYGKHVFNVVPILIGVYIAGSLKIWDVSSTVFIIASLFGTTLAPISGEWGPLAGIVAGFLHLSMTMNVGVIHGGTNLYNNGFAAGLVSIVMVSVLTDFSKKES